jgi:ABC-type antimicrobial peptide transport system permease subunit
VEFTLTALSWFGISSLILGLLVLYVRLFYFVSEKSRDILLLRTLGASRNKNALVILMQGLVISDVAAFIGILLSHLLIVFSSSSIDIEKLYGVTGTRLYWQEGIIYLVVIFLGTIISFFPSWKARQLSIWDISTEV